MTQPETNPNLTAARAREAFEAEEAKKLTPRQRQRLAEDEIEATQRRYNVRVLGVIKTVNGGQQVITWEVVALPDTLEQKETNPPGGHEA